MSQETKASGASTAIVSLFLLVAWVIADAMVPSLFFKVLIGVIVASVLVGVLLYLDD
jgi:hypothetical protein